ncbi:protein SLX4IP isoform X2 [Thalassophryne amazonica]|uniref:protein SLX4IP isoform X2 n=1 Tax=Thalassophryne amazonica TaxID=390379 RepID=UPI001471B5FA|nr:protein SLX4IP isoform X2 [Thalassophryne amazonica]
MAPLKFVIKCGNFAVLVDLHVLPLGDQEDTSWFTMEHTEEVKTVVQDAMDKRVKQYTEFLQNRRQPKQKKELPPAPAFYVKELRVFPERYVVCVRCPEDASAHHGNPSLATTELSEQSRSEYFSRVGETQEPSHSPTKTKKTALQKIAQQACVQRDHSTSSLGEQRATLNNQNGQLKPGESQASLKKVISCPLSLCQTCPSASTEPVWSRGKQDPVQDQQTGNNLPDSINAGEASGVLCQTQISQESSKNKRCKLSDAGGDPHMHKTKRTCLGSPPVAMQTHAIECSSQTSKYDLPLPPLPPVKAKAESKAFPVSECKKTTLEVELLTPGKRAQRLPLTSNNTAQTNQNRLAASLRGLSVKPASSGSSISSRSTGGEGREIVPRMSRLRRQKRS